MKFPRFSAMVDADTTPVSTPYLRPLGSLKGFLLDANPILSGPNSKLRAGLYNLFRRIPSIDAILDPELEKKRNKQERDKVKKVARCTRALAIESPHLGIHLPPAAWPALLSTANRTLQTDPSLQAQAIYDFLVNASATLSSQQAMEPIDVNKSGISAGNVPFWSSIQRLLPWR